MLRLRLSRRSEGDEWNNGEQGFCNAPMCCVRVQAGARSMAQRVFLTTYPTPKHTGPLRAGFVAGLFLGLFDTAF
jgi:hypothetical protein